MLGLNFEAIDLLNELLRKLEEDYENEW